ncbi:MAG: hypothetical protein R2854_24020 [Caldilineaceae bacterium]
MNQNSPHIPQRRLRRPPRPTGGDDGSNNHQLLIGDSSWRRHHCCAAHAPLQRAIPAAAAGRAVQRSGAIVTVPAPNPDQSADHRPARPTASACAAAGTRYDVVSIIPFGARAPVMGRSQDGGWWVINVPVTRNNQGWSARPSSWRRPTWPMCPWSCRRGTSHWPARSSPSPPNRPPSKSAKCTTLQWQVENVSEVYVYPAGASWADYPAAGVGSQSECPSETTTYEIASSCATAPSTPPGDGDRQRS